MKYREDYFARITKNSRPHDVFSTDWSAFTSNEMGDAFLPYSNSYQFDALKVFDGAELFENIRYRKSQVLLLPSKSLIVPVFFTFPNDVAISKNTHKLRISQNELVVFAEIRKDETIKMKFKFGSQFENILLDFLNQKDEKGSQVLGIGMDDVIVTRTEFESFFSEGISHSSLLSFALENLGINTVEFKKFSKNKRVHRIINLFDIRKNEGDGFEFDAGIGSNAYPHSYAHGKIEKEALFGFGYTEKEIHHVYYGNWLRDFSSLITASTVGFHWKDRLKLRDEIPFKNSKLVKPLLIKMAYHLTHNGWIDIIQLFATKTFVYDLSISKNANFPEYETKFVEQFKTLTKNILGVYRPEEHIDNPKNLADERILGHESLSNPVRYTYTLANDEKRIQTFSAGVSTQSLELKISEQNQKAYIKIDGPVASNMTGVPLDQRFSAFSYFKEQIALAEKSKKTKKGLRHLGAALHVLEDYFAHTNFVEISIIKNSKEFEGKGLNTNSWVELSQEIREIKIPIVTGTFGDEDIMASLIHKVAELIFPTKPENYRIVRSGDRTFENRFIISVLMDFIRQEIGLPDSQRKRFTSFKYTYEDILNFYLTLLLIDDGILKVKETVASFFDEWLPGHKQLREWSERQLHDLGQSLSFVPNFVMNHIVLGFSKDIKESHPLNFGSNPTHTQIAKDSLIHPLNPLAGQLAVIAVRDIGEKMNACWEQDISIESLIETADSTYFIHPSQSDWMDKTVINWGNLNLNILETLSSTKTYHEHLAIPKAKSEAELEQLLKSK
jgi:hypothetical protein